MVQIVAKQDFLSGETKKKTGGGAQTRRKGLTRAVQRISVRNDQIGKRKPRTAKLRGPREKDVQAQLQTRNKWKRRGGKRVRTNWGGLGKPHTENIKRRNALWGKETTRRQVSMESRKGNQKKPLEKSKIYLSRAQKSQNGGMRPLL